MTSAPVTIWRPTDGNSEFSPSGNPELETEAGLVLITESSHEIIAEDSTASLIPATVWVENDSE